MHVKPAFYNLRTATRTLYRVLVIFIPFIFWGLPADYFDSGSSMCISKLITDLECPGCGITRAAQHAWHFDFYTAWKFNKTIVVVGPLFLWLYISELRLSYRYFFNQHQTNSQNPKIDN